MISLVLALLERKLRCYMGKAEVEVEFLVPSRVFVCMYVCKLMIELRVIGAAWCSCRCLSELSQVMSVVRAIVFRWINILSGGIMSC